MDYAVIGLLVVLVALVAALLLRRQAPPAAPPAPGLSPADIEAAVGRRLAEALSHLNEENRREREAQAEALRQAADGLAARSAEQLGSRVEVIDRSLKQMAEQVAGRMTEVGRAVGELRESNQAQYAKVDQAVTALARRTENLNEVLSSSQARGQWGERLAEDMLRAAGFVEGVNYAKQETIEGGGRPDYRFDIPPDRVLYMDVKFPLDKYSEFVAAGDDQARELAREAFVRAVRGHVDALAKREYADKSAANTVDYVLMFVPNESISGFVHESEPTMIEYALSRKVVLCSPLNLYAFLVVIRQAADSFHTERTAAEIMQRVNLFQRQWKDYTDAVAAVRTQFDKLVEGLDTLAPAGTRYRKLDVQVRAIEKLRSRQGVGELPLPADEALPGADEA